MKRIPPLFSAARVAVAALAGLSTFGTHANAAPLAPGATVVTPGTTEAARPELAGIVLEDTIRPFTLTTADGTVVVKGTLQDRVVRETAAGTLDFYYRIISDSTSTASISTVRKKAFNGFSADADWRIDGLGDVGSKTAARTADGSIVTFDFSDNVITPGHQSRFVFIKTSATAYNAFGATAMTAFVPGTTAVGASASGAVQTYQPAGGPLKYYIYQLMPPDIGPTTANTVAAALGDTPMSSPAGTVGQGPPPLVYGDGNGNVHMDFDPETGDLEDFTDFTGNFGLPPDPIDGENTAMRFLGDNKLLPAVQDGVITMGDVTTTSRGTATGGVNTGVRAIDTVDLFRTVDFTYMLDGLPVVGPDEMLTVDVGAQGVIGFNRDMRPLQRTGWNVDLITQDQATVLFHKQFDPYFAGLQVDDPGMTYQILSVDLIYYDQGQKYVQPAYRFKVDFGGDGDESGETWIIPASKFTPESITNNGMNNNDPVFTNANAVPAIDPHPAAAITYGIYVVRQDNRFLQDAWNFHLNLDAANFIARFGGRPAVRFNQYYWDYPWLWEPAPAMGVGDLSRFYVGANNIDLYEGHGAPWTVTTRSDCCDTIDYRTIAGYGGFNGLNGKTDYIIWHTCDSIPAPGDPYAFNYQNPSTPFSVWFNVFKGMRGTYGARTTVNIYDNTGPAFAWATGLGVPNLSAWFSALQNCPTGHGNNWDRACAVIISGHENDRIYDTAPLAPPGSLTMYWQR